MTEDVTTFGPEVLGDLAPLIVAHPGPTFAPTPATRIMLRALGRHGHGLSGTGIDWGCGVGVFTLAAARLPGVQRVVGLDISAADVAAARANAVRNGVEDRVSFVVADSYRALDEEGERALASLRERADFVLANPPASENDDGFSFRREVLAGARAWLRPDGEAWLQISSQYGTDRIRGLERDVPGWRWSGVLESTGWVPFGPGSEQARTYLELYAAEEARGGAPYHFRGAGGGPATAREALRVLERDGVVPTSRWQVHRFERTGSPRLSPT